MPWSLFIRVKRHWYPLTRRVGELEFLKTNPYPLPRIILQIAQFTAQSLHRQYSTTYLFHLLCQHWLWFVLLQANKFLVDPTPNPLLSEPKENHLIQNNFLKSSCHSWSYVHTTGDYSSDLYSSHLFYFCGFLQVEKLLKHCPYKCATWQVILTRNLLFIHCA